MTANDFSTCPIQAAQHRADSSNFTILFKGQVIGSAPTQLRSYQLANDHVYHLLGSNYLDPACLSQDEANALLVMQMGDMPFPC
jgi:hypothetical protein